MSGDWIKMRGNLWDDPRVGRICDLTGCKEATAIGGLYWLWATADQHTEDGAMPGMSLQQIDRKTGIKGFGAALVDVGWLSDDPQGIIIQHFEEHNGASAKKRAQTAKRVSALRSGNAHETPEAQNGNAASVTGALAREEKRREEKEKGASADLFSPANARASGPPDASPPPGPEPNGHALPLPTPSAAGLACRAMKQAGLQSVNPGDPRLVALLGQGVTAEELAGVAAEAVTREKGFAWVLAVVQSRRAEAAAISLAPVAAPAPPATPPSREADRTQDYLREQFRPLTPEEKAAADIARKRAMSAVGRAGP